MTTMLSKNLFSLLHCKRGKSNIKCRGIDPWCKEGETQACYCFVGFYFALANSLLLSPRRAWGLGKWTVLWLRRWSGAFVLRRWFWLHLTGLKFDSHRVYSHLIFFHQWWLRQECSKSRHWFSLCTAEDDNKNQSSFFLLKSAPGGVLPSIFFYIGQHSKFSSQGWIFRFLAEILIVQE